MSKKQGAKVKPNKADAIYEEFMKNVCPKMTKVGTNGCKYHSECLAGICLAKYILENYDVREKEIK